jgi:hypothetical protein
MALGFWGFNQDGISSQKEKSPPLLWEKVLVTACAPDCKCVVTATATLEGSLRSLHINKCDRGHDAVIAELDAAARARALELAGRVK